MRKFTIREQLAARFNFLPTAIYDTFPAVLFGRVLVTALELNFFETLPSEAKTIAEVADSLSLKQDVTETILSILEAGGYVKRSSSKYSLTPQSRKWLVRSSSSYIGNFLLYIGLLHSHWVDSLKHSIKEGKPLQTYREQFGKKEWEIYTLGMMDLARMILPHLTRKLSLPEGSTTLLDVCGSHGLYSIEMCKRNPKLYATIIDLPEVLTITRDVIRAHHLEDRITLLPGDVLSLPIPEETYDCIFEFNIIHGFSEIVNRQLQAKLFRSLKPHGTTFILDQFLDPNAVGLQKTLPLMVGINLLNEIGGRTYTHNEVKQWLSDAGLSSITFTKLRLPGVHLIRAS